MLAEFVEQLTSLELRPLDKMTKFQKIFYKWLFSEDKNWNPFTRFLAEEAKDMPKVGEPELGEDFETELRRENLYETSRN